MAVNFDRTDRASIFKYSTGLIDHCLRDFANEEEILQLPAGDKGKLAVFIWENKQASIVSGMAALDIYRKIEDGDDTNADDEMSSEPIIVANRPFRCQKCGGKVVRMVYGMPGPEMYEKAERKEVVLGGCLFNIDGNPQWACCACKQRYWKK